VARPFQILAGTLLALVLMWAATLIYGLLQFWSLGHPLWWKFSPSLVDTASEIAAFGPCLLLLGFLLTKLYRGFSVTSAFASMAIALLLTVADSLDEPQLILSMVRLTWPMLLTFLVGPPTIVFALGRLSGPGDR
jgi:hypothetical protein